MAVYVILHNVRSAHNVGSVFRTSDGAGVAKIFLTGYTPAPYDRFGREQEEIKKTSLGATKTVPYEVLPDIDEAIVRFRELGVPIVAVEQHARAHAYTTVQLPQNVAFIFGNEVAGVPSTVCEVADHVVQIPMSGKKESLNVSVSVGIILFAHRDFYPKP